MVSKVVSTTHCAWIGVRYVVLLVQESPVSSFSKLRGICCPNRNSGAPRNDVIAPIGRITGEMIMRATRSEASMIVAPSASDAGKRKR